MGRKAGALEIILLRHGFAGDRNKFMHKTGLPDSKRPLTAAGKRGLRPVTKALRLIVSNIDLILTSPYTRAYETAQILNKTFFKASFLVCPKVLPTSAPVQTLKFLRSQKFSGTVVLVGHEPQLSRFLSFILTGEVTSNFHIKKGGFAIIECDLNLTPRLARLKCLVQPSHIKKIVNY